MGMNVLINIIHGLYKILDPSLSSIQES